VDASCFSTAFTLIPLDTPRLTIMRAAVVRSAEFTDPDTMYPTGCVVYSLTHLGIAAPTTVVVEVAGSTVDASIGPDVFTGIVVLPLKPSNFGSMMSAAASHRLGDLFLIGSGVMRASIDTPIGTMIENITQRLDGDLDVNVPFAPTADILQNGMPPAWVRFRFVRGDGWGSAVADTTTVTLPEAFDANAPMGYLTAGSLTVSVSPQRPSVVSIQLYVLYISTDETGTQVAGIVRLRLSWSSSTESTRFIRIGMSTDELRTLVLRNVESVPQLPAATINNCQAVVLTGFLLGGYFESTANSAIWRPTMNVAVSGPVYMPTVAITAGVVSPSSGAVQVVSRLDCAYAALPSSESSDPAAPLPIAQSMKYTVTPIQ
jgi:hypothetical protein